MCLYVLWGWVLGFDFASKYLGGGLYVLWGWVFGLGFASQYFGCVFMFYVLWGWFSALTLLRSTLDVVFMFCGAGLSALTLLRRGRK
jgi:hypothetical protein